VRVKCSGDDTIGDFKKLVAAQIGTEAEKIVLKKGYVIASFVSCGLDIDFSSKVQGIQGPYHPQ
jgi:hypothetical protein